MPHKDLLLFHANGQHSYACPLLYLISYLAMQLLTNCQKCLQMPHTVTLKVKLTP